jgi:TetR/AcrR family transcriptional regulator
VPSRRVSAARVVSAKPGARSTIGRPSPTPVDRAGHERILSAAIRSFSERGYDGTTTAGVARDAGVTQPLVHHHFRSKDGLWRAAMDVLFSGVAPIGATLPDGAPQDRLLAIVERFVRFVADRPEVTRVITREGAAPSPRLTYLVDRYLRAPFREVVDTVRAGQREGAVAPGVRPDLLLFVVLGAGSHLFDVTALARESVGIDPTAPRTREDLVVLLRTLFESGVLRRTAKRRGVHPSACPSG